ncbi:efflux RND transporter periplasmic adaptor subunit [Paucibacter sp. XJ19-41]|uniref:efflux RND transporter periplasmic adaptor subunit n=1 Tax=Paucibacter sp. XJ19-41 TaxID=2927824 RepID=UPI00234AA74A|nr:efflux RND transporter periplasmic adaptor subunit [Paucibacter sp. XJ19-41]MDC6166617.1 efflux RND transporter periplasmic adaptor subunit [Paucibacter sp. XJ19-41]
MRVQWALAPLAMAGLLAGCQRHEAEPYEEIRPVQSIVAGRSAGTVGARYSGEVVARYESRLGFRTAGKIAARLVEVGSAVKRGQPLMRLSPEQEVLQVVAAGADVDAARSRVAQARIDLQRTEALLARQFASRAELDQQKLALDQAEAQLRAALAQRQAQENQRGYTVLTADRDGVVTAITAEAGQVVAAGQSVVTLAADGDREVAISIPESRLDELRQARGMQVSVWAHPGRSWNGELRELAPGTDSVTRTYSARIAIRNADPQLLRLGMTASVLVSNVEGASAIRLPLTAILDRDGQRHVWIVDPKSSRVGLRQVALGSAEADSVLVASGLNGGETVVTAGVHMLQPGQRVKPPVAAAETADAAASSGGGK